MVIHYQPARLRRNSDQPTALTNVLLASGTGEVPLGTPTCSARTRQGGWALYPNGAEVVVVHPGGALVGPPAEVAGELGRVAGGGLDRAAAWAIRRFLTDPAAHDPSGWPAPRHAKGWPGLAGWDQGADVGGLRPGAFRLTGKPGASTLLAAAAAGSHAACDNACSKGTARRPNGGRPSQG